MDALDLANKLSDSAERAILAEELRKAKEAQLAESGKSEQELPQAVRVRNTTINRELPVYLPPDLERHVLRDYPISHLLPYINFEMLLGRHLGIRGSVEEALKNEEPKALEIKAVVDGILQEAVKNGIIRAQGMYRFFPAQSDGDTILVYDPADTGKILETFQIPRQEVEPY